MPGMRAFEGGTTNPSLLNRVRDKNDGQAWELFVRRYNPLLAHCCRRLRLDPETSDEVLQRVWSELVVIMPSFSQDSSVGFRRWLWSRCRFRAIDLIRNRDRERHHLRSMDEKQGEDFRPLHSRGEPTSEEDELNPGQSEVLREALDICETVRRRVQPQTWQVFWHIAVDGWTVRETSDALKMKYNATFVAHQRVDKKLREEGERRFQG